jgi:hypothetical protein
VRRCLVAGGPYHLFPKGEHDYWLRDVDLSSGMQLPLPYHALLKRVYRLWPRLV